MYFKVNENVKTCKKCRKFAPMPKYKSTLRRPIFDGPLPTTERGNRYMLVAVEHLTCSPTARATGDATADAVIEFVARDIVH